MAKRSLPVITTNHNPASREPVHLERARKQLGGEALTNAGAGRVVRIESPERGPMFGVVLHQTERDVDVWVTPSLSGPSLLVTNLTGHPQVVVPSGEGSENPLASLSFVGRLNDEATLLAVARAYEQATPWHLRHPEGWR